VLNLQRGNTGMGGGEHAEKDVRFILTSAHEEQDGNDTY